MRKYMKNNCSVNLSMSYYIEEHHEIYVYWKNSIYDKLYFCVCFMCSVSVLQWDLCKQAWISIRY